MSGRRAKERGPSVSLAARVALGLLAAVGCERGTVPLPTRPLVDVGPRDAGGAGDTGVPCDPELEVVARRTFPEGGMGFGPAVVPAGQGGFVTLGADGAGGKLARVDLRTGGEVPLGEGFERLVEADETRVLAVRGTDELYLIGDVAYALDPAPLVFEMPGAPARRLDRARVWGCPDPLSLVAWAGDPPAPSVTLNPRPCPVFFAARDDAAVFVQIAPSTGARSVNVWRSESRTVRVVGSSDRAAAAPYQRGAVWVSGSGQVQAWTPDQPDGVILDDGPCVWVDALGDTILMGCELRSALISLGFVDRLTVVTPEGRRELRTGGGAILSPRLGDGFVSWLEYEDPDALCMGAPSAGQAFVAPLAGGDPIALGPVDAPCQCCAAFWRQPSVDARGDTLVYTYPSQGSPRPERGAEAVVVRSVCR